MKPYLRKKYTQKHQDYDEEEKIISSSKGKRGLKRKTATAQIAEGRGGGLGQAVMGMDPSSHYYQRSSIDLGTLGAQEDDDDCIAAEH